MAAVYRITPYLNIILPRSPCTLSLRPRRGDADGAGAELPVEHDDHDLVRGGAALLQRLVRLVNQVLQLLQQHGPLIGILLHRWRAGA